MDWVMDLLAIPKSLLPEVRDSTGDWGSIDASLLGAEIPIRCIVSDQGASLFGSFCFQPGQVRLSMGTGSFLSLNTGSQVYASISGAFQQRFFLVSDEFYRTSQLVLRNFVHGSWFLYQNFSFKLFEFPLSVGFDSH